VLHSAIVHNEQRNIGIRSADLKPETTAFYLHRGRSAPARGTRAAAYGEPSAIFPAENESGLFHAWNDNHAFRLVEQILGDTVIVSAEAFSLSSTLISFSAAKATVLIEPAIARTATSVLRILSFSSFQSNRVPARDCRATIFLFARAVPSLH
jgi:hypothetical protein